MHLTYGTQLSPYPITLSIGTLRKPKLGEIAEITFEKFNFFLAFTKITPEKYYTILSPNHSDWDSLSDDDKENVTMYDLVLNDESAREIYLEIFNFFFLETVIFKEGFFVLLKEDVQDMEKIKPTEIRGVIQEKSFLQILNLIQQICGINDPIDESMEDVKFKNNAARKIYEKILKGKKERQATVKSDINLSIPNIISAVACKHPSINMINIWELTVFQLLDAFNRLQANAFYDIDSSRVSTWGDEKKTFDASLWYKNTYDKNDVF